MTEHTLENVPGWIAKAFGHRFLQDWLENDERERSWWTEAHFAANPEFCRYIRDRAVKIREQQKEAKRKELYHKQLIINARHLAKKPQKYVANPAEKVYRRSAISALLVEECKYFDKLLSARRERSRMVLERAQVPFSEMGWDEYSDNFDKDTEHAGPVKGQGRKVRRALL